MPHRVDKTPPEPVLRSVPARAISIHGAVFACAEDEAAPHRQRFERLRRQAEEMMIPIPVVESANGQLFGLQDVLRIALYHRFAPDALVLCAVVPEDATDPYDAL